MEKILECKTKETCENTCKYLKKTQLYSPENKYYLFLNTSFIKKTKKIKEYYSSIADLILTNYNSMELIFYGVGCVLSLKEYVFVRYLLENRSFNNKNFAEIKDFFEYNSSQYLKETKGKIKIPYFSSNKFEITNFKNKIKKKIKTQMKIQKIEISQFEEKFGFFIKAINYNYDLSYPNEYTTVITGYIGRMIIPRAKIQNKDKINL